MKISEDFRNYDKNNTSEEKVINAHFFSAYKRAFVLKLPHRSVRYFWAERSKIRML